jgi:hypothetical protein
MNWKERLYCGLGEYLRCLGLDCVTVTDFSEEAWTQFNGLGRDQTFFELKISYTDHYEQDKTFYNDRSLADFIKSIPEEL